MFGVGMGVSGVVKVCRVGGCHRKVNHGFPRQTCVEEGGQVGGEAFVLQPARATTWQTWCCT